MQEATKTEIEELEKIREKCLSCEKCPLGKTRTNIVFSGGIPNHKLMLIGEKLVNYWIKFLHQLAYQGKKMSTFATL